MKQDKEFLKKLSERLEMALEILSNCELCPRKCHVNRLKDEKGFCKTGRNAILSSYGSHFGEEKVLVGRFGSGTIFFTHCNMSCVFCQNYDISQLGKGNEVSAQELADIMLELQRMGCHNINLVSPTHCVAQILEALLIAFEEGLKVPIVYNTGGYDSVDTLKLLDGIVDIYMPDIKYGDDERGMRYSSAPNYFSVAKSAVKEMHRQVGDLKTDDSGIAVKGLLVRHLVLPNDLAGTEKVMEFLATEISTETFVNIMDQYRPLYKTKQYPELSRPANRAEFQRAVEMARKHGIHRICEK
ncbi:putative pyruvate formate lyase activating enzyme [Acetomicrobium thermoterrenum DSM 13490]|jgi:putative pyruvate formate lyase activating enzyme|uniref:Putative pyruvate formate lyase activating enzyme n=1 Tax=Acetomicrobium thermoterrenum DSM 13490 TaxID=1120987 RepID=A0A1H3G3J8_9BACT|nr:radical SAM protein [Acetomicrobium thermoterrenum]SDX96939.1 putative pyruvate formate lyase activating enzyme [Acetomicrobium thermoterrenum DSM 13490]